MPQMAVNQISSARIAYANNPQPCLDQLGQNATGGRNSAKHIFNAATASVLNVLRERARFQYHEPVLIPVPQFGSGLSLFLLQGILTLRVIWMTPSAPNHTASSDPPTVGTPANEPPTATPTNTAIGASAHYAQRAVSVIHAKPRGPARQDSATVLGGATIPLRSRSLCKRSVLLGRGVRGCMGRSLRGEVS